MRRQRIEQLFVRYRERGDVGALAEVFDRTAVDLLRLAQHFARGLADAEDLLQETFVTAIERAASYDAARPLLPWLAGILAHKSSRLRQSAQRGIDAGRLEAREQAGPLEAAAARELALEVEQALARLDASDRDLLAPYLRGERRPSELARELGLAPGAVRMRIRRSLERLRRLLPAGVGAGALALGALPRPLSAVRRAVLARAASAALAPASVTLSTAGGAAALLAMAKTSTLVGCIAGSAALAGLLFWKAHGEEPAAGAPLILERGAATRRAGASSTSGESLVAAAPELEQSARLEESARESASLSRNPLPRRSLRIHGRVLGVAPDQLEGVRVSVARADTADLDGWERGRNPANACAGAAAQAQCESCHAEPVRQRARVSRGRTLFYSSIVEGRIFPDGTSGHAPGLATAAVDGEGRFEIELAGAFAEEGAELPEAFEISAEHECYFEAESVLPLPARERMRFLQHAPVALETELELAPAAVVRGTVLRVDEATASSATVQEEELGLVLRERVVNGLVESGLQVDLVLDGGEGGETTPLRMNLVLTARFHSPTGTVALFPLERGAPQPAAATRASVRTGERFELKVADEGPYSLVALDARARPHTQRVDLRLREVVELEPTTLAAGAFLEGILVAPPGSGASGVVALRSEEVGDRALELSPHDLVWSGRTVEWRTARAELDEQGRFRIAGLAPAAYGLAPSFEAELDLASAGEGPSRALTTCVAPASGIVLAPELARLDVSLTRRGLALDELPVPDEEAVQVPMISLRVQGIAGGAKGEFTFADRTRALVLVEPRQRLRCELLVNGELRDARELDSPAAGNALEVSLELGEL